jgi:hypothetical protein
MTDTLTIGGDPERALWLAQQDLGEGGPDDGRPG